MFSRIIKNKNKPTRYTFLFALIVFLLISGAGYIKFNFIDDDIFISGESASVEDLSGSWIEPVPGQKGKYQGFILNRDGTAESINMYTLLILKWRIEGGFLFLTEKSIGNGTSSTGEEKYKIESVGKKSLFLSRGNSITEYKRSK